jgi:glutamate 5-kinase
MFGNNDELSAVVAGMLNAKYLFILTDVEGLYTSNPRQDKNARLIPVVDSVKEVRLQVCTLTQGSDLGTGGMATKITAAELATRAGVEVVICSSNNPEIIKEIILYDNAIRGQDNSRDANSSADEPEALSSLDVSGHSCSRPPHTKFLCAKV